MTLAAVSLILALVVGVLWVDEGEVVTLTSYDEEGHRTDTGLWIIEVAGKSYLRAGSPNAAWLARIRAHPEVELERGGIAWRARATAIDDEALANAVSWAMREKYGLVDAILVRLVDHSHSVPIRIELLAPAARAPESREVTP